MAEDQWGDDRAQITYRRRWQRAAKRGIDRDDVDVHALLREGQERSRTTPK